MTTYQVGQRVVRFRGTYFVEVGILYEWAEGAVADATFELRAFTMSNVGVIRRETEKLVFIHPYRVDDTGHPSIGDYATYRWPKNQTHALDDATFETWVRMERDQNVWREKLRKLETERRQAQLPFMQEIATAIMRKTGGL